jgi:hypothetical protein
MALSTNIKVQTWSGGIVPSFITLALDGGEWSVPRPSLYSQGIPAGTLWIGGLLGPRATLDVLKFKTVSTRYQVMFNCFTVVLLNKGCP